MPSNPQAKTRFRIGLAAARGIVRRLQDLPSDTYLTTAEAAKEIGCAPGTLVKQRSLYRRGVRGIAGGPRFIEPGGNRIAYRVPDVSEHYEAIIAQSYNPKPKWFRKVKDAAD